MQAQIIVRPICPKRQHRRAASHGCPDSLLLRLVQQEMHPTQGLSTPGCFAVSPRLGVLCLACKELALTACNLCRLCMCWPHEVAFVWVSASWQLCYVSAHRQLRRSCDRRVHMQGGAWLLLYRQTWQQAVDLHTHLPLSWARCLMAQCSWQICPQTSM